MAEPVVVVGGGAAGRAAVQALLAGLAAAAEAPGGLPRIVHIAGPAEESIDRTTVDKALMTGRLTPERARSVRPPLDGVLTRHQRASAVALASGDASAPSPGLRLRLTGGETQEASALIVATGSSPRALDVPGAAEWAATGRLSTLHSVADALTIRDRIAQLKTRSEPRVLVTGAGLVGAEAASLLSADGCAVTLVARAQLPGAWTLGSELASRLARIHSGTVDARWGTRVRELADSRALLDDGTRVSADLVVVAHGADPDVPGGLSGLTGYGLDDAGAGVPVDSRLRLLGGPLPIWAAGAIARHGASAGESGAGGTAHAADAGGAGDADAYRIDHWDDAEAQGAHAARGLLHDFGLGEDPGEYVPVSPWSARIHGHQLAGFGHPLPGAVERVVSGDPLVVEFRDPADGRVSAVVGLDAGRALRERAGAVLPRRAPAS